jgi:predicted small secreted protein
MGILIHRLEVPLKVRTRTDRAARSSAGTRTILGRLAVSAVAATMLLGAALPTVAGVGIDIQIAPPAPRVVEVPPPRAGFVWAPGYYRWDGRQHVWVDGRWLRERRGSHWVPEHWNERHGRYHFEPGHWARG